MAVMIQQLEQQRQPAQARLGLAMGQSLRYTRTQTGSDVRHSEQTEGNFVWANSPDKRFGLNVSTIGSTPNNTALTNSWHNLQAQGLSQALPIAAAGGGSAVFTGLTTVGDHWRYPARKNPHRCGHWRYRCTVCEHISGAQCGRWRVGGWKQHGAG
jgi:hypothetical protein